MNELITLTVRSKSGTINDIQVAEIVAIDGVRYTPQSSVDNLTQLVNHLSGRIAAIEQIIGGQTTEQ